MKQEAAELLSNYGGEIYENYSGRGMYGKETTALTFESDHEFKNALADALESLDEDDEDYEEERDLIINELRHVRTDSLGRRIIVY